MAQEVNPGFLLLVGSRGVLTLWPRKGLYLPCHDYLQGCFLKLVALPDCPKVQGELSQSKDTPDFPKTLPVPHSLEKKQIKKESQQLRGMCVTVQGTGESIAPEFGPQLQKYIWKRGRGPRRGDKKSTTASF